MTLGLRGRPGQRRARIASEVFGVGLGQGMAAIGALVGLRVLTTALGTYEFGVLALALTAPLLIASLVYAGPGQAVLRFYLAAVAKGEGTALLAAAWGSIARRTGLLLVASTLGFVIGAVVADVWHLWPVALAALVTGVLTAITTVFDGVQNALRRRYVVAWHYAMGIWLKFTIALVLIRLMGPTGTVALWGYAVASGIVAISQGVFYQKHVQGLRTESPGPDAVSAWRDRLERFSWPFSATGVVGWAQTAAERWGLKSFTTTSVVGEYAALAQLGFSVTALLSNLMLQLGSPIFYQRAGDGTDPAALRAAHRLNWWFLAATGLVSLGFAAIAWLFHERIFRIVVDREFLGASHLLPVAILSGGVLACAQVAGGFILTRGESHRLVMPRAVSAIVGAAAVIAGAWAFGIQGVIWGTMLASALQLVLVLIVNMADNTVGRGEVGAG